MVQQPPANGPITRPEYEARQSALQAQVSQVEARLMAEQTSIKTDMERKFDRVLDGIDKLRGDLVTKDELNLRIATLEAHVKQLEEAQASRMERFWLRIGPIATLAALLIPLIEFLAHYHLVGP